MSEFKDLKEKLCYKKKNGLLSDCDMTAVEDFCSGYMKFLSAGKTERLCVKEALKIVENAGFSEFSADKKYKAGDKVSVRNRSKTALILPPHTLTHLVLI